MVRSYCVAISPCAERRCSILSTMTLLKDILRTCLLTIYTSYSLVAEDAIYSNIYITRIYMYSRFKQRSGTSGQMNKLPSIYYLMIIMLKLLRPTYNKMPYHPLHQTHWLSSLPLGTRWSIRTWGGRSPGLMSRTTRRSPGAWLSRITLFMSWSLRQ